MKKNTVDETTKTEEMNSDVENFTISCQLDVKGVMIKENTAIVSIVVPAFEDDKIFIAKVYNLSELFSPNQLLIHLSHRFGDEIIQCEDNNFQIFTIDFSDREVLVNVEGSKELNFKKDIKVGLYFDNEDLDDSKSNLKLLYNKARNRVCRICENKEILVPRTVGLGTIKP